MLKQSTVASFKNRIAGGAGAERLRIGIVVGDKLVDVMHTLLDARERSATARLVSHQREESFDPIKPGPVDLHDVLVPPRPARQTGLDRAPAIAKKLVAAARTASCRHVLVRQ